MNAPSVDIKEMLVGESVLGLSFGTNLFIGMEPDAPNQCVTIFDTMGRQPKMALDKSTYEYPSVQIRVRDVDYDTGWALIEQIKNSLHGRAQESWGGALYSIIYVASGPAMLDFDSKRRVRFIINFNLQRR